MAPNPHQSSSSASSTPKATPTNAKRLSPTPLVGGVRRTVTPKRRHATPIPSPKVTITPEDKLQVEEESFDEHQKLCDRFAKSLYFANKLPTTPRPSFPLSKLAVNTFTKKARQDTLSFLDLEQAAEIGRNACVTPTALIMALVYLERLSLTNPGYLGATKPSELFVVSLMVASKFVQDEGEELGIFNDEWATSANMELKELNKLELQFLCAIGWSVNVKREEYDTMLDKLEGGVALQEGRNRGWFTYTDLDAASNLLNKNLFWPTLYHHFIQVIIAASVTYATLLATMLTSTILAPAMFEISRSYLSLASTASNTSTTFTVITPTPPTHDLSLSDSKPQDLDHFMHFLTNNENETQQSYSHHSHPPRLPHFYLLEHYFLHTLRAFIPPPQPPRGAVCSRALTCSPSTPSISLPLAKLIKT